MYQPSTIYLHLPQYQETLLPKVLVPYLHSCYCLVLVPDNAISSNKFSLLPNCLLGVYTDFNTWLGKDHLIANLDTDTGFWQIWISEQRLPSTSFYPRQFSHDMIYWSTSICWTFLLVLHYDKRSLTSPKFRNEFPRLIMCWLCYQGPSVLMHLLLSML